MVLKKMVLQININQNCRLCLKNSASENIGESVLGLFSSENDQNNKNTILQFLMEISSIKIYDKMNEMIWICKFCAYKINEIHYFVREWEHNYNKLLLENDDQQQFNFSPTFKNDDDDYEFDTNFQTIKSEPAPVFDHNTFNCNRCDKQFSKQRPQPPSLNNNRDKERNTSRGKSNRNKHIKQVHMKVNDNIKKTTTRTDNGDGGDENAKKNRCLECFERFSDKLELKNHKLERHNESTTSASASIACCSICGRTDFQSMKQRSRHERYHKEKVAVTCPECQKEFPSPSCLRTHIAYIHKVRRNVVCPECGKRCFSQQELKKHQLHKHSDERPIKCTFDGCPKYFKTNANLKDHLISHTGEKRHECKICDKRFSYSSSLKAHMRYHNNERPYICKVCDKKYTQSCHLRRHCKRSHPDYFNENIIFTKYSIEQQPPPPPQMKSTTTPPQTTFN